MKAKHTPGPWGKRGNTVHKGKLRIATASYALKTSSLFLNGICIANQEEAEANAKLIAAAPEMIEALMDIVDAQNNPKRTLASLNAAIKKSEDVIKKATK